MSNTFVDTLDDSDVMEMQDNLTPEEKADWLCSIEHDLRNPNRGKVHRPIEVFWQKLEDSVRRYPSCTIPGPKRLQCATIN